MTSARTSFATVSIQWNSRWMCNAFWVFLVLTLTLSGTCQSSHSPERASVDPVRCIWRSSISSTLPDLQEAHPRPSCETGEIWWFYPRGAIRIHFRHETPSAEFRLSLLVPRATSGWMTGGTDTDRFSPDFLTLFNETQNGGSTLMELPVTDDEMSATSSVDGRVVLKLAARDDGTPRVVVLTYHRQPP